MNGCWGCGCPVWKETWIKRCHAYNKTGIVASDYCCAQWRMGRMGVAAAAPAFRTNSVFQGKLYKASCSRFWMIKIYIQYSEFSARSIFQGKCKLFKILNDKKFIFSRVNLGQAIFFKGKRKLLKILNYKKCIFNTLNSGQTLFFRASASCSKFWMIKNIYSIEWIQGKLCFSRQAQVVQNSVW